MFELKKGKKILCILTNTSSLSRSGAPEDAMANRTGFDVKAVAYIWEYLKEKHNFDIHFVTPAGGEAPMDPRSVQEGQHDNVVQKFLKDRSFVDKFKNTDKLSNRLRMEEYTAVFIPGSHGVMLDLPEHRELNQLIATIYEEHEGCVATLGHGIAGLLNVPSKASSSPSAMEYLLKDKRVCFSTMEEDKKINMEKQLPYCLEDKIKQRGARIQNKGPFEINVVVEERLITAQNTQSAKEWIMTIIREAKLQ